MTGLEFAEQAAQFTAVFVSRPGPNAEFRHPTEWSRLDREGNDVRLKEWRHGDAVCALTGHGFVVVDVDPQNGGDATLVRQALDALGVRLFAEVATPGGGRHFYVATHPDVPTSRNLDGHPGVDIQSHGAMVYLPGTCRPKYDGAEYEVVFDNLEALADGGDPDGAEALAHWVATHRPTQDAEPFTASEPWDGTPPDQRQRAYLSRVLEGQRQEVASAASGSRNHSLFTAALKCGSFVKGAGLDSTDVQVALMDAATANGLTDEDGEHQVRATIASGLRVATPRQVPDPPPVTTLDPDSSHEGAWEFAQRVDLKAYELRVLQAAREKVAAANATTLSLPDVTPLQEFLAVPDEPTTHRVAGLWPEGGRVVLAAPHKVGKTTLAGNLIRALADGTPFLDAFPVIRAGRVVIVDNELDERMLRRWLRDQGLTHPERVAVLPLRGRLSAFNILDPATRTRWAEQLGPADVLVFDCLRPALDALGLSEDKDGGRFLEALDELTTEAQIANTLVNHHMGHSGERPRGDSRIQDWPDALWQLVTDKTSDDPGGERVRVYFKAYGRDVDQTETLLAFDPAARRLSVAGGSRSDRKVDAAGGDLLALLAHQQPLSGNQIEKALGGNSYGQKAVRDAIHKLVDDGLIRREARSGKGGGKQYRLT